MEILLDPDDPTPRDMRMPAALTAVDEKFDRALEKHALANEDTRIEHGRAQAHAILEAWYIIHGSDLDDWTVLHKEMRVRTAPDATIHSPLLDRMAGMIDGVLLDPSGRPWILENKTRKSMMGLTLLGLELNAQVLWYMILCIHTLRKQGKAIDPLGFIYNGMMKPQHRMNMQGFSDLKARMIAAILDNPDKYFVLEPIPLAMNVVNAALANFARVIAHMDALSPATVYQNLNSCGDFGGCPYAALCRDGANAADPASVFSIPAITQYQITGIHTELEDDLQDTDDLEKY
jgi:hypothetical protein